MSGWYLWWIGDAWERNKKKNKIRKRWIFFGAQNSLTSEGDVHRIQANINADIGKDLLSRECTIRTGNAALSNMPVCSAVWYCKERVRIINSQRGQKREAAQKQTGSRKSVPTQKKRKISEQIFLLNRKWPTKEYKKNNKFWEGGEGRSTYEEWRHR